PDHLEVFVAGNNGGIYASSYFAPSSGVQHRAISLDYIQGRLDVFFNSRERPLFKLKLDSKDHTFGESALTVASDSRSGPDGARQYDFTKPLFGPFELAGPGSSLDFQFGPLTYKYYFQ